MNIPEEGYYYLTSKEEPEPVLVHGYRCTDMDGQFVFGFNTHDGGALVPLFDLSEGTTITRVSIIAGEAFDRVTDPCDGCHSSPSECEGPADCDKYPINKEGEL